MPRLSKIQKVSYILYQNEILISDDVIGQRTTPSTVAFTDDAQRLVGVPAKRQVSLHLQFNTFTNATEMARHFVAFLSATTFLNFFN